MPCKRRRRQGVDACASAWTIDPRARFQFLAHGQRRAEAARRFAEDAREGAREMAVARKAKIERRGREILAIRHALERSAQAELQAIGVNAAALVRLENPRYLIRRERPRAARDLAERHPIAEARQDDLLHRIDERGARARARW